MVGAKGFGGRQVQRRAPPVGSERRDERTPPPSLRDPRRAGREGGKEWEESEAADRRGHLQLVLAILRLSVARHRGDLPAVVEQAQRLLAPAEAPDAAQLGLGDDLRALALLEFGVA